jgi:hypothetical protein
MTPSKLGMGWHPLPCLSTIARPSFFAWRGSSGVSLIACARNDHSALHVSFFFRRLAGLRLKKESLNLGALSAWTKFALLVNQYVVDQYVSRLIMYWS